MAGKINSAEITTHILDDIVGFTINTGLQTEPSSTNIYWITKDPQYIIDGGVNAAGSAEALPPILESLGCDLSRIKGVLLTHGHNDHFGLAPLLASGGAPIFVSDLDREKVADNRAYVDDKFRFFRPFLSARGVSEKELDQMNNWELSLINFTLDFSGARLGVLSDGDEIETGAGTIEVIATPGHSMGHMAFFLRDRGLLFTGDALLYSVAPLPVAEPNNDRSAPAANLPNLLKSMSRMQSEPITLIAPGHGEPVTRVDHAFRRIERYFNYGRRRLLRSFGGEPADLPTLKQRTEPGGLPINISLRYSEILGLLDLLIADGEVEEARRNGQILYRPTGPQ